MKQLLISLLVISSCTAKSVPTEDLVYKELKRLDVKNPEVVLAQSKLETGHYKSKLCKTHNNLFGFRVKSGYLKFKSWRESVRYYKKWQQKRYKAKEHKNYYNFLKKVGYAEDPQYIQKVKRLADERRKSNRSSKKVSRNKHSRDNKRHW